MTLDILHGEALPDRGDRLQEPVYFPFSTLGKERRTRIKKRKQRIELKHNLVQADKCTGKDGSREPIPYLGKTGTVREMIRTILDAWIKRGTYCTIIEP